MAVCLLDANYLLRRSIYAVQSESFTKETITLAFLKSLKSCLDTTFATACVAVWDGGYSRRRLKMFPGYKAERREKVETLESRLHMQAFYEQTEVLKTLLPKFGVYWIKLKGREADDIIAMIVPWLKNKVRRIAILTGDRDIFQMVDRNVIVYNPDSKKILALENFEEVTGIQKKFYILHRSLVGEKSRNGIDGVPLVGDKTAAKLLSIPEVSGFIDLIYHCMRDKSTKAEMNIVENFEVVCRNMELLDLTREVFTDAEESRVFSTLSGSLPTLSMTEQIRFLRDQGLRELISSLTYWVDPFNRLSKNLMSGGMA